MNRPLRRISFEQKASMGSFGMELNLESIGKRINIFFDRSMTFGVIDRGLAEGSEDWPKVAS